ncbi:MAG: TylF/MycF/NovP-related O-methyltransferase [bacterium]
MIDDKLVNTSLVMLAKQIIARLELAKLGYYKRNPTEKTGVNLVKKIYHEEKNVLFYPGELLNVWTQALIMKDQGAFAEVGVFRGASAKLICEAKGKTPLYLFDTFRGLPEVGKKDARFKKGLFTADEQLVRQRLKKYPKVKIYPGYFPDTAGPISRLRFSFVHLDVDLQDSTNEALKFFYPRMIPGGRILSHDYGQNEGVWRAFNDFIKGKPEKLQPMETTQVLLIKKL